VKFYTLQEVRLEAEEIKSRPAVQLHVDNVLQAVQQEIPGSPVESFQHMKERLFALFVAFQYLDIFEPAQFIDPGLNYLHQLEEFHRENGEHFAYAFTADSKIRKKVDEITTADPTITFPVALSSVLEHHKSLWDSAISKVERERLVKAATPAKRPADPASPSSPSSKRAKRRKMAKERQVKEVRLLPSADTRPHLQRAKGKGKGGKPSATTRSVRQPDRGGDHRIPKDEMDAIMGMNRTGKVKRACKWYNSSVGCSQADGCLFEHRCIQCGLNHSWADQHKR
jgi:hypothetical protein